MIEIPRFGGFNSTQDHAIVDLSTQKSFETENNHGIR